MSNQGNDVAAARDRLSALLAEITVGAAQSSLERCPYRTRADVCTFRGECQNRIREHRRPPHCMGGQLDGRPAAAKP